MYMIKAALEYLISILVATTFLATLTTELGISDILTGILSSIISLGCVFQLLSLFFRRSSEKRFVIILSILNQCLFMFLYVIPLFSLNKTTKTMLFVVAILLAYMLSVQRDKNIQQVALLFILWNMAQYVSTPFFGTYRIKELGFSLKFVSITTMLYSIVRILFSKVFGRYADKTSFTSMIQKIGNSFMRITQIYAQQVVSRIALIFTIACVLYIKFVMKKVNQQH